MMKVAVFTGLVACATAQITARGNATAWTTNETLRVGFAAIEDSLATANAQLEQMSRAAAAIQAGLNAETSTTTAAILAVEGSVNASASQVMQTRQQEAQRVQRVGDLMQQLSNSVRSLDSNTMSTLTGLNNTMTNTLRSNARNVDALLSRTGSQMTQDTTRRMNAVQSSIQSTMGPLANIVAALGPTHYLHPEIPVFRWHMFHVYSNNGIGWFDGNNPRHFGNRHPSQWGDGNTNVWDMHPNIRQMARIFTRRGVGTTSGATVCSETWYLYSSTDTKYCVALFRIKNTRGSNVGWRINWYGTGWSGWGNLQTASINGAHNFRSSCTWWCHRAYTFTVPGNRVSTIVFANGMTHPNHYSDNHHIETTFLGFDGLGLPSGLQYCDDMDVANGNWR